VLYRATDAAGNTETPQAATVRIDNPLPTATDDAPGGTQSGPLTMHISGDDAFSGVASICYSLDNGAWTEAAYRGGAGLAVAVAGVESHTLRYYAIDGAGNLEAGFQVCTVTIAGSAQSAPHAGRLRLFVHK